MDHDLDRLLSADEVMARYGFRDRRAARTVMDRIGAIRIGRRVYVRAADVARFEASQYRPPARRARTDQRTLGAARQRGTGRAGGPLAAGWWRKDARDSTG